MRTCIEVLNFDKPQPVVYFINGAESLCVNVGNDGVKIKPSVITTKAINGDGHILLKPIQITVGRGKENIRIKPKKIQIISAKNKQGEIRFNNQIQIVCHNQIKQQFEMNSKAFAIGVKVPDSQFVNDLPTDNYIQNFELTTQKDNYVEFSLNFIKAYVIDIENLPDGLFYDKGVIKGTPSLSGLFSISIRLSSETAINGSILVPQLQRKL